MKRMRDPCSEPRERGFERVARKRVGVLCRRQPFTEPHHGNAVDRGQQNFEHGVGVGPRREQSSVDYALDVRGHLILHLPYEAEPLPVLADTRNRAIEEHQGEILGMALAELVQPPEACADLIDGICGGLSVVARKEDSEPLFGERQEDVVLAGKIAVDGGRAVLNLLRDLADRDVLVTLGDKQIARSVQNRPGDRLPFPFLTFLDSHSGSISRTN
jgi:hypothetical protein